MKKIILYVSFLMLIVLTGCKEDVTLESPYDTQSSDNRETTEIEEYTTQEQIKLTPVKDIILIDEADAFADDEMEIYKNEIISIMDSFCADIFNFQGADENYTPKLLSYYADTGKYPRTNYSFCSDVYTKFSNKNVVSEYISVNISDIKINVSDPKNDGSSVISATTKGYITADLCTSEYKKNKYNTIFKAALVYDNGWKVLDMELCQVFEGDVIMEWQPSNYETVSVTGNFVFNWDIGIAEEE